MRLVGSRGLRRCAVTTAVAVTAITAVSATVVGLRPPASGNESGAAHYSEIGPAEFTLLGATDPKSQFIMGSMQPVVDSLMAMASTWSNPAKPAAPATPSLGRAQTLAATAQPAAPDPWAAFLDALNKAMAQLFGGVMNPTPPTPPTPPVVTPPPNPVPPGLRQVFAGNYDTGNLGQWAMLQAKGINAPPPPNYCTYSACVKDGGLGHPTATRFELRDGDVPPFGGGERVEVSVASWHASRGGMVAEGDERWYQFSMKFESDFQNPRHGPESWLMVMQWIPTSAEPPRLTIQVTQDNFLELGGAFETVPYRRKIAPIRPGEWVDYVVHVKFSKDPNVGWVEAYENGELVVERHNRATLSPSGVGSLLKEGIYRDAESSGTQVVWHDGMIVSEGATPPPALLMSAPSGEADAALRASSSEEPASEELLEPAAEAAAAAVEPEVVEPEVVEPEVVEPAVDEAVELDGDLEEVNDPEEAVDSESEPSDDAPATVSVSRSETEDADDEKTDGPPAADVKKADDADKDTKAASEPESDPAN